MQDGWKSRRILLRCAVVAGFLVIAMFVAHMVRTAWIRAERNATRGDLRRIMQAMHQYHDTYESFPPAFVVGPDGRRWHSWRALILPWLEPELARR